MKPTVLRTPLAAARANLELAELHEGLPQDERRRLLAEASAELRELTALIDDVVELARADAEVPARQDVRLDHLVEEAVATASRRSATAIDADLRPTVVNAAPEAVTRAVANLIDNAVKWSPDGEPIEVTVKDGTVKVRDHGPGIDPADLPHIFDRFYRASDTKGGAGLGLAIAKRILELHGTTLSAESEVDRGTTFTFELALAA